MNCVRAIEEIRCEAGKPFRAVLHSRCSFASRHEETTMQAHENDILSRALRRREALIALGGLGVGAFLQAACGSGAATRLARTSRRATAAATCVLSPEATDGPYYIANHLTRRNIT